MERNFGAIIGLKMVAVIGDYKSGGEGCKNTLWPTSCGLSNDNFWKKDQVNIQNATFHSDKKINMIIIQDCFSNNYKV